MNTENFKKVLAHIEANLEKWEQTDWRSTEHHSFIGWAQVLSGKEYHVASMRKEGRIFIGTKLKETNYLLMPERTIEDFKKFLKFNETNLSGYDEYGYDYFGYDRYGYWSGGWDGKMRNMSNFDKDGYDRFGRDFNGYDRNGIDCDGFDRFNNLVE